MKKLLCLLACLMLAMLPARAAVIIGGASKDLPALNPAFGCEAHSVRRDEWYERQLLIDAADLPGARWVSSCRTMS